MNSIHKYHPTKETCGLTRKLSSGLVAILVTLAFFVTDSAINSKQADARSKFVAIGTGGPTGVYFVVGNAICRMVHKEAAEGRKKGRKHGLRCSAPSTAGSNYNIGQIRQGALDFGVAQSDWQYHAYNGTSKYKGKRFKNLRAVFSVHPEPFQILVGRKSGIKKWEGLKGKRVNIGNPGSGQRGTMEVLMEIHNVKKDDFAAATELTSSEQSKALCDGNIDAYGYTVGVPNAGVAQAADGCGARIIPLNTAPIKKLVKDNSYYAFATIPKKTYATIKKDVPTFGVKATFVTSANQSAATVYEITRAVFENLDDFKKLSPTFAHLHAEKMITEGLSAPIHRGALKYYKEKGWK